MNEHAVKPLGRGIGEGSQVPFPEDGILPALANAGGGPEALSLREMVEERLLHALIAGRYMRDLRTEPYANGEEASMVARAAALADALFSHWVKRRAGGRMP